jgi:hypothetical protein
LWLITVIPVAVITCVRGRWLYFFCGWLTLGIVWYVGALGREPDQPAYEPRQVEIVLAATAVVFLALGLFGARPSTILGVDGGSLQSSVGNDFPFEDSGDCERKGDDWTCSRWESQFSSRVPYRVEVDDFGCWEAVRVGDGGEGGSPRAISGCVTLYDFVAS